MVRTLRPNANETPSKPIPSSGKLAARTALPQPPSTSQNVPTISATYFFMQPSSWTRPGDGVAKDQKPGPLHLERDVKAACVARARRLEPQGELLAAILVDAVVGVAEAPAGSGGTLVRSVGEDALAQRVVEVELRRELGGSAAHLEVDVHGAARIPAGVDGGEAHGAVAAGQLVAAQELLTERVEARVAHVGVDALRIAVPQVDRCTRQRRAAAPGLSRDQKREHQRHAGSARAVARVRADVGAVQAVVDEVGALGLLGDDDTRGVVGGRARRERRGEEQDAADELERVASCELRSHEGMLALTGGGA